MDSSNLQGILIQWLRPKTEIDFQNVLSTDWMFIKNMTCPRMDGGLLGDLGNNMEWLAIEDGIQPLDYDSRLLILVEDARPTNTPHSDFPNYKRFYKQYALQNRTVAEVSESIIQEENAANNALDSEADVATMNTFALGFLIAKQGGNTPTSKQINAVSMLEDIQVKKSKNGSNRAMLIEQVKHGNFNIDISSGWERDNIPTLGEPFN